MRRGTGITGSEARRATIHRVHPDVEARLARLAPDQRAAATAPSGPILCVAPAGSGKTTTLVARAAWLIDGGTPPDAIRAITFNKRAAEEMTERLDAALEPLGVAAGSVAVRTFHALGREILRDAGVPVEPLADRDAILRRLRPDADAAERMRLDTAISRLKLELGVTADQVAKDPDAGPTARAFVDYERAVAATGGLDFDDLVLRAIDVLSTDESLLARWRGRCRELLVDEVQDVDRAQLRLALLLAAPANRIFLVGDDDQSIYGWRLADVRRVLGLAALLPGLRRVDLEVNHRCPPPVVERAVRLVAHNRERFAKRIRAGTRAKGSLVLAPDGSEETVRLRRVLESWPDDGSTRAVLARTNRELLPAVAVALELGWPFRAPRIELPVESPLVDEALEQLAARRAGREPLLVAIGRLRTEARERRPRGSRRGAAEPPRLGGPLPGRRGLRRSRPRDPHPARRAPPRRRDPQPCHRPCHQGPRVRPRRRHRDGGGPLPERTLGPGRRRPGAGPRGGTPARLRGVDARPADPDPAVRPAGPVAIPARGVQPGRARAAAATAAA